MMDELQKLKIERDRFAKLVTYLVETGRKWDGYTIDYRDANECLGRKGTDVIKADPA